jgi:copper(I)-binding protein
MRTVYRVSKRVTSCLFTLPGILMDNFCVLHIITDRATDAEVHSFINEIGMMKSVGRHINVISFIGCCTQQGIY